MPATILIVDDEPANLSVLSLTLEGSYRVRAANSGERALELAQTPPPPDLILLDILMPRMDGHEVLRQLKQHPLTHEIPVIFFTAMDTDEDEEVGLALGAVDYISKPIKPAILQARIETQLKLKRAQDLLHDQNTRLEVEIENRLAENQIVQNVSIRALAHLAEIRDPETGDHILRTQSYVELLARLLQGHPRFQSVLTDHYCQLLTRSAPLHDIGKVGIPDHILLKPGKLSPDEWSIMQGHAALGAQAIERAETDVDQPVEFLATAKEIAHWHHERWDGKGYPDGLAGEEIPLAARLMAIADVFDALISARSYKQAMSFSAAREIIEAEKGHQFDPDIAQTFLANYSQFVEIANRYQS